MAERKTVHLEKQQLEGLDGMVEAEMADNSSEALRNALNVGLTKYGMLNDGHYDTRLRQTARRFGDAFALLAVLSFGLTFMYPVEFRLLAVAPLAMSLGCYALDRVLKLKEPGVSKALGIAMEREKA